MARPVDWEHVEAQLRAARDYWLVTVRYDGRPHAMPIWGVWEARALWFGTGMESVKGRNLVRDRRCTIHLESGTDVVILDGTAELCDDDDAYRMYSAKYEVPADPASFAALPNVGALYRFTPVRAQAWQGSSFVERRSTFRFHPRSFG